MSQYIKFDNLPYFECESSEGKKFVLIERETLRDLEKIDLADHDKHQYQQGIADERPKAFAKGYDSGYQQGRADAIEEVSEGLIRLIKSGYDTYYIKDELEFLKKLRWEQKK